jgi:iron-sulfur cluster protein
MYIQLVTNNICQLRCYPCLNRARLTEIMEPDEFKFIVNKLTSTVRLSNVDLTPIVGDFYLTPRHDIMINILENKREVENYDVVTNLLAMSDTDMDSFVKSKKTQTFISIYGHDNQSYLDMTGTVKFPQFEERLNMLYNRLRQNKFTGPTITFYMRYDNFKNVPYDSKLFKIIRGLQAVYKGKIIIDNGNAKLNYDWAGQLPGVKYLADKPEKKGICLHAIVQTAILPNFDVTLCGMVDINRKMLIGNILDQSVEDIYGAQSKYRGIVEKQSMGVYSEMCNACREYEYYLDEPEMIEKHKLNNEVLDWI